MRLVVSLMGSGGGLAPAAGQLPVSNWFWAEVKGVGGSVPYKFVLRRSGRGPSLRAARLLALILADALPAGLAARNAPWPGRRCLADGPTRACGGGSLWRERLHGGDDG